MSKLIDWLFHRPPEEDQPAHSREDTDAVISSSRDARGSMQQIAGEFRTMAEEEGAYQRRLRRALLDPGMDYRTMNQTTFGRLPKRDREQGHP